MLRCLSLLLSVASLSAAPLPLRSQLQPGAPMTVEADAPEGDYLVKVTFGGDDVDSVTTLKAESRRLLELGLKVPKGGSTERTYRVQVHQPEIKGGGKVSLKSREVGSPSWDGKLSLEFLGATARVRTVEVTRDTDRPVYVRVLGDSTVTDQTHEPYCGWGQMLPVMFGPDVVVDNHAESGLALSSFRAGHRLDKVLSSLNEGDFVLIQFGHNDQKEKGEGAGAFTTYAKRLREYVGAIREKKGNPILITPVARRRFDSAGQVVETLGDYPEAVRRVAAELKVPLVDLNASSKRLYQALGEEKSKLALLHIPAGTYPGQTEPIADNTHFSAYGAYEMARCVAEALREAEPALAAHLRPSLPRFDPSHPDDPAKVVIAPSPYVKSEKPEGK